MENKYNTLFEFKKDYPNEYHSLYRKKLLEQLCNDMNWEYKVIKPAGYWNIFDNVYKDALKYDTKEKWRFNGNGAYEGARKNTWFEECTAHMPLKKKPRNYWTKELCIEEALKYNTKKEWSKNSSSSHSVAIKSEWYEESTKHMKKDGK